jgi:hypothetical protein
MAPIAFDPKPFMAAAPVVHRRNEAALVAASAPEPTKALNPRAEQ